MKKTMIGLSAVALLAAFAVGCKEDLDAARASLSSVTKERDDLSARVVALQRELDLTKAELVRERARSTTASADVAKGSQAVPGASEARPKEAAKAMAAKHGASPAAVRPPSAASRDRQKPRS
jgi:peptidoglycan hydrolase CwlO-like protein